MGKRKSSTTRALRAAGRPDRAYWSRISLKASEGIAAADRARESEEISHYDCLIINDDLDRAVEEVHQAIQTFKHTPKRERAFIEELQQELRAVNSR